MPQLQPTDAPGKVVRESLADGSRIQADEEASSAAEGLLAERARLKAAMRACQDADDESIMAHGRLEAAELHTDRCMVSTGSRIAGRLAQPGKPGETHKQHTDFFAGRAPSAALPAARRERTDELDKFLGRIKAETTPAEVRRDAADLGKAMTAEKVALAAATKADEALAAAKERETEAKLAVIAAQRATHGELLKRFPAEPARVRRLMGQGTAHRGKAAKSEPAGPAEPGAPAPETPTT